MQYRKKKKKLNTLVSEVKTPWIQTSIPPHSRCDIQFLSFLYCKMRILSDGHTNLVIN